VSTALTRRSLLASGAALYSAAASLGGPVFLKLDDPGQLAAEHRRLGYSAAYCPQADVKNADHIRAIEQAFVSANIIISEVGAWKNLLDPDAQKRAENLRYVTDRCALADAVGARCCVDIAGSYNPAIWYGPDPKNLSKQFFDATVENCRTILDAVKPTRTKFTIEMMGWNLPDGPDSYLELIRAVDRPAFGVHLDVCNGVNSPTRFYNNAAYISECFAKLGGWIASCHAKDLRWIPEYNVHFEEVIPGRGQIDYARYLSELAKLPGEVPLMLEHLKTPQDYEEGASYIRRTGNDLGLTF
jgi:sugar phosphate isomerase/epimerase